MDYELMTSVIKYYETTPAKDEMQQEQRAEMKEKVSLHKYTIGQSTDGES